MLSFHDGTGFRQKPMHSIPLPGGLFRGDRVKTDPHRNNWRVSIPHMQITCWKNTTRLVIVRTAFLQCESLDENVAFDENEFDIQKCAQLAMSPSTYINVLG